MKPEEKETDFNDLHQVKGLEAVKTAVDINRLSPQDLVKETDLAVLATLAGNWVAEPNLFSDFITSNEFPIESLPPLFEKLY